MNSSFINWTNIYGTCTISGTVGMPGLHLEQDGPVLLKKVSRAAGLGGEGSMRGE